jgi:hypothetical protein
MEYDALVTIRDRIAALYRSESRRVFASLVRLLKDFDLADDAMHEAFAAAVEIWQRDGVPENPRAWLISTESGIQLEAHARIVGREIDSLNQLGAGIVSSVHDGRPYERNNDGSGRIGFRVRSTTIVFQLFMSVLRDVARSPSRPGAATKPGEGGRLG